MVTRPAVFTETWPLPPLACSGNSVPWYCAVGGGAVAAAVVKVVVIALVMAVPLELVTLLTVKVYVVPAVKAAVGVKVATYVVALYVTAPATALFFPFVSAMLVAFTVVAVAGPENVTRMAAVVDTEVAPVAGEEDAQPPEIPDRGGLDGPDPALGPDHRGHLELRMEGGSQVRLLERT